MDLIPAEKSCSICGQSFTCGSSCAHCWCAEYPPILPIDFSSDCQCPACLAQSIGNYLDQHLAKLSLDDALSLAKRFTRASPPVEGIDYHLDQGLLIFSRWYLLKRGSCCGESCRNCPYGE